MKKEDLEKKNPLYKENIDEWQLYSLVYNGGIPLIKHALHRYSNKESIANWNERILNGFIFNYAQSIVDLYNFYLTEKAAVRDLDELSNLDQWKLFDEDCDLNNTNFDAFINESQKLGSVSGSIGILVNKPGFDGNSSQDEIDAGVYPYVCMYSLSNIYDWTFERNPLTHRKILAYLKLFEEDGSYLLWWPDKWERWELEKRTKVPKRIAAGINPIGEIPFVWMPNLKRVMHVYLGVSDIVDISRIVTSTIRNLSCGEEILKLAGFPMLRIPLEKDIGIDEGGDSELEDSGPRVVHEYDASFGEAGKPDWMPTEILAPIEAILKWIDRKIDESYRIAHLSGMHGQRTSSEPQSGLAMRYAFQQLFAVLSKKSENMTEAELQIIRLWLKWQNKEKLFKTVKIKRIKDFSVDDLAVALDNAFTSMRNMVSKTFRVETQMKTVGHVLPDLKKEVRDKIRVETEANTPDNIPLHDDSARYETGGGTKVRPADQA